MLSRIIIAVICLVLHSHTIAAEPGDLPVTRKVTPTGVSYGVWGNPAAKAAPTLVMLSGTIESTLEKPYFRQCGNELSEVGFLVVSIDIPCHGDQVAEGQPAGLSGWSHRAARDEDFVGEFNSRMSQVLDHLIASGLTDPDRIAVGGTSRGGFLAIHFAAHDQRVKCAAGFAPVTDLSGLSEFRDIQEHPLVARLNLANQAEKLAGRPVWIIIGDRDERVGTQHAMDLAIRLSAAARERDIPSNVQIQIMSEPRGHSTPQGASKLAAEWVLRYVKGDVKTPASQATVAEMPLQEGSQLDRAETPQTLLLVDDHHVMYRSGTRRVFHPAIVNPSNPVIREEKPWEMAIAWTSVVRHAESGKYQLWYQAYGGHRDARKTHRCVVCIAESDDGINFTKPDLSHHDFKTDREPFAGHFEKTNIVLLGGGGYGDRYANSVLYEPESPDPARRYKMLYTDFAEDQEGQEWPAFHAAFSPDGVRWTKAAENPLNRTAYGGRGTQPPFSDENVYSEVWDSGKEFTRKTWRIPFSMSDAADVFYDPRHEAYVVYGKAWIQGPAGGLAWKHAMARVESKDFLTWTKPQLVANTDDLDPVNTEFHTSPVFFKDGCYFCLNQILSARGETTGAKADAMHIELMISRDGLRWDRPFRETPFIAADEQAFSNGGVFTNATPVYLDDQIRFYYGGYNSGAIGGGAKLTDPSQQSGVGFASIERDRFAGIRPVAISAQSTLKKPLENIGQITLKPIGLEGVQDVSLNADARGGEIRVELLDEDGYRVRGYSRADAVPLRGDSLSHRVTWNGRGWANLPAGKYSLRLHLDNAEVFAVTLIGQQRSTLHQ